MKKEIPVKKYKCIKCKNEYWIFKQGKNDKFPKKGTFICDNCNYGAQEDGGEGVWLQPPQKG